jgi:hypothetical protein
MTTRPTAAEMDSLAKRLEWMKGRTHRKWRSGPTEDEISGVLEDAAHALRCAAEDVERLAAGEASDGYHTHNELYEYRMLYNAHSALGWRSFGYPVVKSRRHSDGEPCFGGGWFIVVAQLSTGQVSNHYRDEHWDLFDVPEVELAPEYDGHTPADVAVRLARAILER